VPDVCGFDHRHKRPPMEMKDLRAMHTDLPVRLRLLLLGPPWG
jgi:hypothetical protein